MFTLAQIPHSLPQISIPFAWLLLRKKSGLTKRHGARSQALSCIPFSTYDSGPAIVHCHLYIEQHVFKLIPFLVQCLFHDHKSVNHQGV